MEYRIKKGITRGIVGIFSLIVLFLTVISIISTCEENQKEHIYFVKDYPVLHLVTFIFVLTLGVLFVRFGNQFDMRKRNIVCKILLAVYTCILVIVTLTMQIQPVADQKQIVDIAKEMIAGDFSEFAAGGYLSTYSNQIGITCIFYCIFKCLPFGVDSIRILNVFCYMGSLILLNKIGNKILGAKLENSVGIMYILFIPLTLYIPFIYGNMIGFFFSLLAIKNVIEYREIPQIRKVVWIILGCSVAVLIKQNYLITVIAVVLYLIGNIVFDKNAKAVGVVAITIIAVFIGNFLVTARMESLSGEQLGDGLPAVSWVAMGLQQGTMANGWYNSYNIDIYEESGYDRKNTEQVAITYIKDRFRYFAKHPSQFVMFFLKKNASQWNHSTFEGFWINSSSMRENLGYKVENTEGFLCFLTDEKASLILRKYCNIFQTIILLGACAWLVLSGKKITWEQLILAVVFIGGFLFHTFWEAKSQYTLTYFVLLIPYSVAGLGRLISGLNEKIEQVRTKNVRERSVKNEACKFILVTCVFIVFCACIEKKLNNSPLCYETELYYEYLNEL